MIKLLVLCLLATLVTMGETTEAPKPTKPSDHKDPAATKVSLPMTESTKTTVKTTTAAEHKTPPTTPLQCHCDGGPSCDKGHCTVQGSKRFCVTMAESNNLGHSQSVNAKNHTCWDSALDGLCNSTITITLSEEHYWRSNITCCSDIDNCNSQSPKAPPANTAHSKLVCPYCFKLHDSTCKPTIKKCAASETQCISVIGTVKDGDLTTTFAGQGCATPSAKKIKNGTTLVFENTVYHFTSSICRDATDGASRTPGSVPFTILLTSFVGLLQAKLIY